MLVISKSLATTPALLRSAAHTRAVFRDFKGEAASAEDFPAIPCSFFGAE
jgi:hypothetical protein